MSSFERRGFADQLSIETPEQVALEYSVAGLGSRFVAVLLDHVFVTVGVLVLLLVLILVGMGAMSRFSSDTAGKWFLAGCIFVYFLLHWGYFLLFEAYWHGQTPGKRIMKLRVIKDSGRQITLFESMTRNLLRFIDQLPTLYLTGVITMLCNKRNKRLGDLAAGTVVIHERVEEQPLIYSAQGFGFGQGFGAPSFGQTASVYGMNLRTAQPAPVADPALSGLFPADALHRLGPQDLVVIETFFARALDLPLETRAALGTQIAQGMAAKMGVELPPIHPERALEAMAVAIRGGGRRG